MHDPDFDVRRLQGISSSRLIPSGFIDLMINRYFPVLSFTFLCVLAGVALKMGGVANFFTYFLRYKEAYQIAAAVGIWVSVPAMLWIIMRVTRALKPFSDIMYAIASMAMIIILLVTVFLFPQVEDYHSQLMRLFIVAAIPVHVVQYVFLVKSRLDFRNAQGLNIAGAAMFIYGLVILH